jgi:hypothetical protein
MCCQFCFGTFNTRKVSVEKYFSTFLFRTRVGWHWAPVGVFKDVVVTVERSYSHYVSTDRGGKERGSNVAQGS